MGVARTAILTLESSHVFSAALPPALRRARPRRRTRRRRSRRYPRGGGKLFGEHREGRVEDSALQGLGHDQAERLGVGQGHVGEEDADRDAQREDHREEQDVGQTRRRHLQGHAEGHLPDVCNEDDDTETYSKVQTKTKSQTLVIKSGKKPSSVAGSGGYDCPKGYPIKGNASSGIYHIPGGASYDRTKPEECFASKAAAERAGYRQAKR